VRFGIIVASMGIALAGAASAQTPNVSGVWQVRGQIVHGDRTVTVSPACTIQQSGGRLSGDCVGPNGRGPLAGSIAGDRISWTWKDVATTAVGVSATTNFNGTYVNDRLIRGTMNSTAIAGTGNFTQTR